MREGIRSSLAKYEFLEIAGEARNGEEAVRQAKELMADVILVDITQPGMNGLEAAELICRAAKAKVLILTVHKNPEYVRRMIHCGARGYVLKDASGEELARAIKLVAGGRIYFSPEVSREAIDCFFKRAEHAALSEREVEILKLVARGCSSKEIAPRLNITCRTVETHRERIMTKLGVHNIAGLTRFAISAGLIDVE